MLTDHEAESLEEAGFCPHCGEESHPNGDNDEFPHSSLIGVFYTDSSSLWLDTFEGENTMIWDAGIDLDRITDIANF